MTTSAFAMVVPSRGKASMPTWYPAALVMFAAAAAVLIVRGPYLF